MTVRIAKQPVNIREKLSELERPIGLKGSELMKAETAQEARELVGAGRKNLLINGDFRISQRGDYTSATVVGGTSYTLDRWKTLYGGGGTVQRKINQLLPNGDISDSVRTITTATGYVGFEQFIEFPEYYSGQTFTISFWIKTNYVSTEVNVYNGSTFVLSSSRGRLNETSGEWKYFSKTFTMPTSGNSNFRIEFWTGTGSTPTGSYIEIAQVQVERGTLATEFEHRSFGEELALCQRYYYKTIGDDAFESIAWAGHFNTTYQYVVVTFPTSMRTEPAVDLGCNLRIVYYEDGSTQDNITDIWSIGNVHFGNNGGYFRLDTDGSWANKTGGSFIRVDKNNDATAFFSFDSEL